MKRTVFFTNAIKLVNNGYNNKIVDEATNRILDEITDTLVGAVEFVVKNYGAKVK